MYIHVISFTSPLFIQCSISLCGRLLLECDGTRAEKPDFFFAAKLTSPFKSAGGRQFSPLLSAEVCATAVVMMDMACSEVCVKGTGYPLHSTVYPFISPPVCQHLPSHFNCTLQLSAPNTPTVSPQHTTRTTTLTLYSSQHLLFVSHNYITVLCSPKIVCLSNRHYPTCVNLIDS